MTFEIFTMMMIQVVVSLLGCDAM